jgi:hypothetical protein
VGAADVDEMGSLLSPSLLGPLLAEARREGYHPTAGTSIPYHGYYYKMLTGQGPSAPGVAYDYVVRSQMLGGFAIVAYPAQYGSSGIMTFIVNHDSGAVHDEVQSRRDVEETLTL